MASPSPVTMPSLVIQESSTYVVRKGASIVLGQAARISLQSNVPTRKLPRLGDTNKKTSYGVAEHSIQLEIYAEQDPIQLAQVLGGTTKPVSGGWAGTEELRINPTVAPYTLYVDVYDGATGTADDLVGTWTLTDFKPSSLSAGIQGDSPVSYQINGEVSDIFFSPEAGVGA